MSIHQSKYDRYNASAKGQARYETYKKRHPDRVKASGQRYASSGHCSEHRHKIQDEAGCHMKLATFYPGFRFVKALRTAEIVEIKGITE